MSSENVDNEEMRFGVFGNNESNIISFLRVSNVIIPLFLELFKGKECFLEENELFLKHCENFKREKFIFESMECDDFDFF